MTRCPFFLIPASETASHLDFLLPATVLLSPLPTLVSSGLPHGAISSLSPFCLFLASCASCQHPPHPIHCSVWPLHPFGHWALLPAHNRPTYPSEGQPAKWRSWCDSILDTSGQQILQRLMSRKGRAGGACCDILSV